MTPVLTPARTGGSEQGQLNPSPLPLGRSGPTLSPLSTRACLLLALVLPVFGLAPLLYPGYFLSHEGLVPLWNIGDLRANMGDLSWLPQIGTRFDPLRSTGLLPYHLAGLLPLAPAAALKTVVGASWLLGSLGMFFWLRGRLGPPGAAVAGLVYSYLPYQLVNLYVRGAWGETLLWGLLPWAIWITSAWPVSPQKRLMALVPFLWLALGLSQLGLALWLLLFVIVLLLAAHRPQALWRSGLAGVGLLGTGVVYLLLPPHTLFVTTPVVFSEHWLYPFQLFSAYWGFGASRPGWNDGLSFQVGLVALGLSFLAVFLWRRNRGPVERYPLFFGGAAILLSLLQFPIAAFFWDLPLWPGQSLAATLSYPWQLLGLIGLSCAVLAGSAWRFDRSGQLQRLPVLASCLIAIVLSVYPYLLPQFLQLDDLPLDRPEALLGETQLALLNHSFGVLTPGYTTGLDQGETVLPLAVYGPLQAGDLLMIEVTWQPLQIFKEDLKVFVHLVDANEQVLAQFDGQPQEGRHPTSHWVPGELIQDRYPLAFPAEAPPGPYRVFIGLYDEASLLRLPVQGDSAGRVILEVK